jgi:hypothetical protein
LILLSEVDSLSVVPIATRFPMIVPLLVFAVGCSGASDRKSVYPVSGAVFVNGQPAAGARLFFHPADDPTNPRTLRPFAVVADDGSFKLTTYLANDGAPAGEYVVTVTWPAPRPGGATDDGAVAPDRLKGAYATPVISKLRATIQPMPNRLEPFQLK